MKKTRSQKKKKLTAGSKMLPGSKQLKPHRKRKKLLENEWHSLFSESTESKGLTKDEIPAGASAFQIRQRSSLMRMTAPKIPNWIKSFIEREHSMGSALEYLLERVEKAPNTNALVTAQFLINELLKTERGKAKVTKMLNQNSVQKFIILSLPPKKS